MSEQQKLSELMALHDRLETDVRRSRRIDPDGLTNASPLVRNLRANEEQIRNHPDFNKK
jgi:hypothetical protein